MHIPRRRLDPLQPSVACYRPLNVSKTCQHFPPASVMIHTKLEGKMIPYKEC
jgi:hypothetical protein